MNPRPNARVIKNEYYLRLYFSGTLCHARRVLILGRLSPPSVNPGQIDWEAVESEFAEYYCAANGRPSVPIRTMVGMMLLKNITFPTDAKLYWRKFCKRAGIEPVIGHLKSDHRMMRNYLKGTLGYAINTMMAAAACNMRHWMNKHALSSFVSWLLTLVRRLENVLFENENQYAWKDSTLALVAK